MNQTIYKRLKYSFASNCTDRSMKPISKHYSQAACIEKCLPKSGWKYVGMFLTIFQSDRKIWNMWLSLRIALKTPKVARLAKIFWKQEKISKIYVKIKEKQKIRFYHMLPIPCQTLPYKYIYTKKTLNKTPFWNNSYFFNIHILVLTCVLWFQRHTENGMLL